MIAGAIAGLLAFGAAKVFGEAQIERAIAFEQQHAETGGARHAHPEADADQPGLAAHQHVHGEEAALVSREVQSTIGLFTAVVVYGAAMGGLFALAFASLCGRLGNVSPRLLALLLAAAAFAALYYVPSLKYPANPPAVGDGATIGQRTGLFFLMIVISLAALVLAVAAGRRLVQRLGGFNAALAGAGVFIAIVAVAQFMLPEVNEVPPDFPAELLWKFRMASLGLQALMWATLGLLFGALAERVLAAPSRNATRTSAWA
jgi:predicted cobalt transporter CbtA